MKNLLNGLAVFAVATLIACNSVDQEAVTQAQNDLTAAQESLSKVESAGKGVSETLAAVNNAPDNVKATPMYEQIKSMAQEGAQKHEEITKIVSESQDKLKALIADYSAGKISTEEFKKQEAELTAQIKKSGDILMKVQDVTSKAGNMLQSIQTLDPQGTVKPDGQ